MISAFIAGLAQCPHTRGERMSNPGTIDPGEVARFDAQAIRWWDPEGEAKPLHRLNPTRLRFIRDRFTGHFSRDARALKPFAGLRLLDIGCGAGLVAEPMSRLGFAVTGIDAGAEMLAAARAHAEASGLDIAYRDVAAESLAEAGERYDAVLALEVVEHVPDSAAFLGAAARLVAPGGALIVSTFNRNPRSFVLGVIAAEHLLRWVPRGTHDWRRFRRPSELAAVLRQQGLRLAALEGLSYDPRRDRWRLSRDIGVNYLLLATRPPA
jgi:2-polyprenyl-6-hydroxyphenyl methylase / 3-demethylubiquinone-9 3-methyltransferase